MITNFLAIFSLCLTIQCCGYGQCTIYGKVIANNSRGISNVKISIKTDERIQKYSSSDGSFKIESRKLKYGDYITLYIEAKKFEPIDDRDLTIQIQKDKVFEIQVAPVGLKNQIEKEFVVSALQANTKELKRLREMLGGIANSSTEKRLIEDSIRRRTTDDSLIIKSGVLYAKSALKKKGNNLNRSLNLIKQGKTEEAKKSLTDDDAISDENNIHNKIQEWYEKAELLTSLLEYKKADEYFIRALSFSSTNINYIVGYASFLIFTSGKSKDGLELLDKLDPDKIRNDSIMALIYNAYGAAYADLEKKDIAQSYYFKQIELAEKSLSMSKKNKIKRVAIAYNNIGNLSGDSNDSISVAYYKKGLQYLRAISQENLNDTSQVSVLLNSNIGKKYKIRGNLQSARFYFAEALRLINKRKSASDFQLKMNFDLNLGLAEVRFKLNKTAIVIDSNNIVLDSLLLINTKFNNHLSPQISSFYLMQASNYADLNDHKNALNNYKLALSFKRFFYTDTSIGHNNEVADLFLNIAYQMKNLALNDSAKIYYDSARMFYLKSNTLIDFQVENETSAFINYKFYHYINIANWYRLQNDQNKRFQNLQKAQDLIDKSNLSDFSKVTYKIDLNYEIANYLRSVEKYSNAYPLRLASIELYESTIKNPFTNDLKVANLAKLAGDEIYSSALENDSAELFDKSIKYYLKALEIYNEFYKSDSFYCSDVAYLKYSVADAYRKIANNTAANKYYLEALENYLFLSKKDSAASIFENLYGIYFSLGRILSDNDDKKLQYLKGALKYANYLLSKDSSNEGYRYNKGAIFNNIGHYYHAIGLKDSAVNYFNLSLEETGEFHLNSKQCLACWLSARENIADYFENLGETEKEFETRFVDAAFLEKNLKLDSLHKYFDLPDSRSFARIYLRTASILYHRKQYDSAIISISKAIFILNKFYEDNKATNLSLNASYNNLGFYQILIAQPQAAITSLTTAMNYVTLNDTSYREGTYINLIFGYIFNENFSKAKNIYRRFVLEQSKLIVNKLIEEEILNYEKLKITHKDFVRLKEYISKK